MAQNIVQILEDELERLSRYSGNYSGNAEAICIVTKRLEEARRTACESKFYSSLAVMLNDEERAAVRAKADWHRTLAAWFTTLRRGPLLARIAWLLVGIVAGLGWVSLL